MMKACVRQDGVSPSGRHPDGQGTKIQVKFLISDSRGRADVARGARGWD